MLSFWDRSARGAVGPIGVELGESEVHLAQFRHTSEGPRLSAHGSATYPDTRDAVLADPRALRAVIRAARSRARFRGRRAVAALRGADLVLRVMSAAARPGEEEGQHILRTAHEQLGIDLSESVVDYLPIRVEREADATASSALVAIAQRSCVVERLDGFEAAGLQLDALEIAPLGARRLLRWSEGTEFSAEQTNAILVSIGRRYSDLVVLWGRRLILYRPLQFTLDGVTADLAKAFEIEAGEAARMLDRLGVAGASMGTPLSAGDEDFAPAVVARVLEPALAELSQQIDRATEYTASVTRGGRADRIRLLGAAGRWPGLEELLCERVGLPVHALVPSRLLGEGRTLRDPRSEEELAIAMGCALRGVLDDG